MRRTAQLIAVLALVVGATTGLAVPADADAWVERAQRRLNELGCSAGPVDGVIGSWTRSAVIRFQSRHRLAQTGRLDETTRTRMYRDDAHRCDRRPVPRASGTGKRIVVSERQNWIWLVRGDGSVRAQGGIVDNPGELSPGRYRTDSYCGRAARIRLNSSGEVWMDNFIRFAPCGFGFHRIPRAMSTGEQIHPNWILGTNLQQSHGCIRLTRHMSLQVWDFTAVGATAVSVV